MHPDSLVEPHAPLRRVLVYSHDTFGLGNIRRMLEVARHLVEASPRVQVLVVTGSPMLHAFRIPPRVDYIKLPCLVRDEAGRYGARSLSIGLDEVVRLRTNLIRSSIEDFAPDLILVDKKPYGVEDELAGSLAGLGAKGRRPRLMLLLRDILDSPEATARVWRRKGYFEAISAHYDQVLVVGCPEVFDLRHEYRFPPFAAAKVAFCGYIARAPGREPREAVRRRLGLAEREPLLLVTPGGGQDGAALVSAVLAGLALLPPSRPLRCHVVCGPEMATAQQEALTARAATLRGVTVQTFSDDMMSLLGAADLVVSMGGYNTVCELLTLGRRALVVPRVRPSLEQCVRAERLAGRGLLRMLHPEQLNPVTLMSQIQVELSALARGDRLPEPPPTDGLARVSALILDSIGLRPLAAEAAQGQGDEDDGEVDPCPDSEDDPEATALSARRPGWPIRPVPAWPVGPVARTPSSIEAALTWRP